MSIVLLFGGSEQPVGSIEYTVEVQWKARNTDAIVFDSSTFGEGDTFVDPVSVDWDGLDVEEVNGIIQIRLSRGRDDNLSNFGMGECQITVEDTAGLYNPSNASSALFDYLRPMQFIRVKAQVTPLGGVPLPVEVVFEGLIRNIDYNRTPLRGVATFTCADALMYFNRSVPVFSNQLRDTATGEVLTTILDVVGWSEDKRVVDTGDVIPDPGVSNQPGGGSALSIMQSLMQIARGDLYISRSGDFTFYDRDRRATAVDVATYTNVATAATTTTDIDRVRNKATVTRETTTGNFTSIWADGTSIADYGQQDFSSITSPIIYDQPQALALAQWLVYQRSNPLVPFRALETVVNTLGTAEGANEAIKSEIGDRVVVTNATLGQAAKAYYIEGVSHEIRTSAHTVRLALLPLYIDSLVLNDASRGRLDFEALAY